MENKKTILNRSMAFIGDICASANLEREIRIQRTYAVCMYMVNVLHIMTVEEAEEIMDEVKDSEF